MNDHDQGSFSVIGGCNAGVAGDHPHNSCTVLVGARSTLDCFAECEQTAGTATVHGTLVAAVSTDIEGGTLADAGVLHSDVVRMAPGRPSPPGE